MKVFSFLLATLICSATITDAQVPNLTAENSFGGSQNEHAFCIQQTKDGGSIIAGGSESNSGDVTGNHGENDFWIVKLKKDGSIQWQKSFGGSNGEIAFSIQQTSDGGYIAAGQTSSLNGDVTGNHSGLDFWVIKLDTNGNLLWQKTLGGSSSDYATSIQQTKDGGYIAAGSSSSNDGDVSGHHGLSFTTDYWVVKLNASGNIQWQKSYGGSNADRASSVSQARDSGYIIAGNSISADGDVSGTHDKIYGDAWIIKTDKNGNIIWQKTYGGSDYEEAKSIQQTTDGGYITAGWNRSKNGDVTGNHGDYDFWVLKLNSSGSLLWQKSLGGSSADLAYSIQQTTDKGYIVAGGTSSNDGDVIGNHGKEDFWVVKLNSGGNLLWQHALGGSEYEEAHSLVQSKDGGYLVAGFSGVSNVNNGDVTGNHGNYDYWVAKLSASGAVPATTQNNLQVNFAANMHVSALPNPAFSYTNINITGVKAKAAISILNRNNETVFTKNISCANGNYQQQVNTGNFLPGVYFIAVQSGNENARISFIKE